jgi:hypothetical protein
VCRHRPCQLLTQVPVDRSATHPKCSGDLGERVLARVVHLAGKYEFCRRHARRSAALTSSGSCRSQPGQSALANEVALKLGQRAEDMEDQLAARRGRIDVLLQATETNLATLELGGGIDQMTERASQPIEFPDHECVARPQLIENLTERWTVIQRAADGVDEVDRLSTRDPSES